MIKLSDFDTRAPEGTDEKEIINWECYSKHQKSWN